MCSWDLPWGLWEEGWTLSVGLSASAPKGLNQAIGMGEVYPVKPV